MSSARKSLSGHRQARGRARHLRRLDRDSPVGQARGPGRRREARAGQGRRRRHRGQASRTAIASRSPPSRRTRRTRHPVHTPIGEADRLAAGPSNVTARSGDGSIDIERINGRVRCVPATAASAGDSSRGDVNAHTGDGSIKLESVNGALNSNRRRQHRRRRQADERARADGRRQRTIHAEPGSTPTPTGTSRPATARSPSRCPTASAPSSTRTPATAASGWKTSRCRTSPARSAATPSAAAGAGGRECASAPATGRSRWRAAAKAPNSDGVQRATDHLTIRPP